MAKNQPKRPTQNPAPRPQTKAAAAQTSTGPNHLLWIGLCLLATLLAYWPNFSATFVNWDDGDYAENVLWIRTFAPIGKFFTTSVQGNYHPLTMLTLALNYKISGLDAWSYHVVNVLLHLANTGLAYWLAWRLSGGKFWVAALTGILFGLHPMHVESVAWVTERKDVLYALFFLLGLIQYHKYVQQPSMAKLLWVSVLFLLSLASKPSAVVFPVTLFALDYWLNRKFDLKLFLEKVPMFVIAAIVGYLTVHAQGSKGALDTHVFFGKEQTFFYGFYSYMTYWWKMFVPTELCTFHGFPAVNLSLPLAYKLAPLFALALGGVLWYTRKGSRLPMFAVAFFTINLVLVLQFFIVGSAIYSDRYSYIPYWSGFFLLGYGLDWLISEKKMLSETAGYAVLAVLAVVFGMLCSAQVKTWTNGETLWDQAIKTEPSARAYSNRAALHRKKKENDKAYDLLTKALVMNRADDQSLLVRGNIYFDRGEYDKAFADYNKCLEVNPNNAACYSSRGSCYGATGQLDKGIADITKALEMDSTDLRAYVNRGLLHSNKNEHTEALKDYLHYLQYKPEDADIINAVGVSHFEMGNMDKALAYYNEAIRINPKQGVFLFNRGKVKLRQGDKAGALQDGQTGLGLGARIPEEYFKACQ